MMLLRMMVSALLLVALFYGAHGAVDLTVTSGATGSAVVQAVVDMVSQSCVFKSDRLMLRRIAYAETKDGADSFTHGGGIWQVDEASFRQTKRGLSAVLEDNIEDKFGIDWTQAQYSDLSKPLYSGIAAMLKIAAHYASTDIPVTIRGQANYWATSYTVNTWTNAIQVYVDASATVATICRSSTADVVFVIDSSGSIGSNYFLKVKSFIRNIVDSFDISNNTVRVGLVQFSSSVVVEFDLLRYSNKNSITAAVQALQYHGGGTNSHLGLNKARQMIQQQGRHDDGVPVVVIFFTDGGSSNPSLTRQTADDFHTTLPEVTMFAVGVTSGIVEAELRAIASEPKCSHVYLLESFTDIASFSSLILKGACDAQAELDEDRKVSGTLEKDQQYNFKIRAKKNKKGVLINTQAQSGAVTVFVSWSAQNPSEAVHDNKVDVDGDQRSVYIGWNEKAERNSVEVLDANNQTTLEAPLYGAVVGVKEGQTTFTLSYSADQHHSTPTPTASPTPNPNTGHADQHTGHLLLSLFSASVVLVRYYF